MKKILNNILNKIFVGLGFVFVGLGVVGMILPVLPTVPFMLLAMICFTKGSNKVREWFMTTKLYKKTLYNYNQCKGMTFKAKASLLISVTILIAFGFIMMKEIIIGRIIVVVVWLGHIIHFGFRVKTLKEKDFVNYDNVIKESKELSEEDKGTKS